MADAPLIKALGVKPGAEEIAAAKFSLRRQTCQSTLIRDQ
jgi:hypothetical protein